jgi:hypothetical protein
LHHPAKQEGSTGRGSSAIREACDLAFLHSLNKESQLITLKVDKNRNGEGRTITVRADFEQGRFQMTESPYITTRNEEFAKLEAVIAETPGITQNGIVKQSGMMKASRRSPSQRRKSDPLANCARTESLNPLLPAEWFCGSKWF